MTTANLTLPYSLEAEQEVLGGLMLRVAFIAEQTRFTTLHANSVWQGAS
ncbi:hypothetical protein ACIPIN_08855 [Pseudomonas sp. NPDC087697]